MRLHASAIEKLVYLFQTYGGSPNEVKLKRFLSDLDFTPYERKTGEQDIVLVTTEHYLKALNNKQ